MSDISGDKIGPNSEAQSAQPQAGAASIAKQSARKYVRPVMPVSNLEHGLAAARRIIDSGHSLKPLTAKQMTFATAFVDGATASEAYRYAYDDQDTRPSMIAGRAAALMALAHVASAVNDLRVSKEKSLLRDREKTQRYVIDKLQLIVETAGNHHSARVHALTMLGKVAGLFGPGENGSKPRDDKRSLAQIETELAAKLKEYNAENAKIINGLEPEANEPSPVIANNLSAEERPISAVEGADPAPPGFEDGTPL